MIKDKCGLQGKLFYTRFVYENKLINIIKSFEEEYSKNNRSKKLLDDIAYSITLTLVKLGLDIANHSFSLMKINLGSILTIIGSSVNFS